MGLFLRLIRNLRAPRHEPPKDTLYDIFLRNRRRDIYKWHHYFDIYEGYLAPWRGRPISLLEIGILQGGSLRMWREYFGASAKISGMDLDPAAVVHERDGYRVFIGDQADREFLGKVKAALGTVDILIDDGGHTMAQQVTTFEELYPITRHFYVVEDTHTSYWARFQDRPAGTFIDYAKAKVDTLHEWHPTEDLFNFYHLPPDQRTQDFPVSRFCAETRAIHFHDSMVVFEKAENPPRWHELR